MNRSEAIAALAGSRVARLATTTPGGRPHIVPVTLALCNDAIVTMVDHKPKTTRRLQRLVNLEHDPRAGVLADHYSEDWSELWWVRVDGRAGLHLGDRAWDEARVALAEKYPQYRDQRPEGHAIVVSIDDVSWWQSTP